MQKKILFIQGFSLKQFGGGAEIIKKLISHSSTYNYTIDVAVDLSEVPSVHQKESISAGEYTFKTSNRRYRFGVGRVKGFLTAIGLDFKGKAALHDLFVQINPQVIHVTAHGVGFPVYFAAALANKPSKVIVSVHDLWHLTVKKYLPSFLANYLFKKILSQIDLCCVISPEMGDYLVEKYGLKKYVVIHDGFIPDDEQKMTAKSKPTNCFLYAGILHGMQLKALNQVMDVMASIPSMKFSIGICSNTVLEQKMHHKNIELINYGWVGENQFMEISQSYAFGLLPLSFEAEDLLFYRTSLMTKIPFYLKHKLPIFCIGPFSSAASRLIQREQTGICVECENDEDLKIAIENIVRINPNDYIGMVVNTQISIQNTFNADIIAEKFYTNLN